MEKVVSRLGREDITLVILGEDYDAADSRSKALLEEGVCLRRVVVLGEGMHWLQKDHWHQLENRLRHDECGLMLAREPRQISKWFTTIQRLILADTTPVLFAQDSMEGIKAIRMIRWFKCTPGPCAIVWEKGIQKPAGIVDHTKKNVVYCVTEEFIFSAREARTDWSLLLSQAMHHSNRRQKPRDDRSIDDNQTYIFKKEEHDCTVVPYVEKPIILSIVDQLGMIRDMALTALTRDGPHYLRDGRQVQLVPSNPQAYLRDYAEHHYVQAAPGIHELCLELCFYNDHTPLGYIAIGPTSFGDKCWPFALPERPNTDLVAVSRLVVLPKFRAIGASDIMLHGAGRLFAQHLSLPLRIATRKPEVADKVFRRSALLAPDNSPRRSRLNLQAYTKPTLALVPYLEAKQEAFAFCQNGMLEDPAAAALSTQNYFHTHTPAAAKPRGQQNHTLIFWYIGTPVIHPDGRRFIFVGGKSRFEAEEDIEHVRPEEGKRN